MILPERNCIFIHVPRTGGKTVYHTFGVNGKTPGRHFFARRVIAELGETAWNSYFKFSTVRNPWDRAVSLFFHQTDNHGGDFKKWLMEMVEANGRPKNNGEKWKVVLSKGGSTGGSSTKWKSQTDWLINDNKCLAMDFIIRFENFSNDLRTVCDKVGLKAPPRFAHENQTNHQRYTEYYDDETIKLVADWHRRDIQNFGYVFGESKPLAISV